MTTFDSTKRSLPELLKDITTGKIQLPDFQRGWVWDDDHVQSLLVEIQDGLLERARDRMEKGTREVNTWEEFTAGLEEGGFLSAHWDGTAETEERIKKETKATIRCIPLQGDTTPGTCIRTGEPSARRVLFARAY